MTDDSTRVQVAFHAVDQEVRSWRRAHPDASLTEIERQLDTRLHAVRAALLADAPDDHQPEPREDGTRDTRRVLGVVKSNLAAKPPARWCIQPIDGPLRWLPDPSPVTVDECFFSQSNRGGPCRPAEEWLKERLAGGSQPSKTVESAAKDAGISRAALKRARASLNVKARKEPTGQWVLSLPPQLTVVTSEGVHLQDVNALHNESESKGLVVNALNPFRDRQAERVPQLDLEQVTQQDEGSKGLNSTLKGPDEPLQRAEPDYTEPTGTNGRTWEDF